MINPSDNIDDQYDEAMALFGGKIPKISEPVEYIVTDKDMSTQITEAYEKAMIEKYGHIPELNHMVPVDDMPNMTEEEAKALVEKHGPIESTVSFDMDDFD